MQQEVERIGVDLGMPTRTELNSVHKRMHDLRRELRASQEAQNTEPVTGATKKIAAMRAEIDDLRRLLQNSGTAAPARKPTAGPPLPSALMVKPNRTAAAKRVAPAKRLAAKRTHVAAKSTVAVGKPEPAARARLRRQHGRPKRGARGRTARSGVPTAALRPRIRESSGIAKAGRREKGERGRCVVRRRDRGNAPRTFGQGRKKKARRRCCPCR
jgi:hypothetical protein